MSKRVKIYSHQNLSIISLKQRAFAIKVNSNGGMGGGSKMVYTTDEINDEDLEKKFIKIIDVNGTTNRIGTSWISNIKEGEFISLQNRNTLYFIENYQTAEIVNTYSSDNLKPINDI